MDWQGLTKAKRAACRLSGTSLIVVGVALALFTTSAFAQARSGIRSRDGDQKIAHNERPEAQVFSATVWEVDSKSTRGATVSLSCGPFQNSTDSGSYVDGQLRLRLRSSQKKPNWSVQIAADRTNIAGGNKVATVMAASEDKGSGVLELEITFLGAGVFDLVEGEYITTVTGTITAR